MEMVALTKVESQQKSLSDPVTENGTEAIRALIYTTCYNVLDG